MTRRIQFWAFGVLIAAVLVLGFLWRNAEEARRRATHDATADSLARNTRDAVTVERAAQLTSDSTVTVYRDRWRTLPSRIDTLTIPAEAREVIRSCTAAVTALETSCSRKDDVITALRAELDHAQNPPPGKRLSYFAEGSYSLLDGGAVAGVGAAVRLVGSVSLVGKVEGASERSAWREPETRALVGLRITFK